MTDNELVIEQLKLALFEAYLDSFYSEREAKEKVAFHSLLDDDSDPGRTKANDLRR